MSSTEEIIERASKIVYEDEKQSQEKHRQSPHTKLSKNKKENYEHRNKKEATKLDENGEIDFEELRKK